MATMPGCIDVHGQGMSYCWECKDTVERYNDKAIGVSACIPPSSTPTPNAVTYYVKNTDGTFKQQSGKIVQGTTVPKAYLGNLQTGICAAGGGLRYPGLFSWELASADYYTEQKDSTRQTNPQFNSSNWAGIDCSGLVTRTMQKSLQNMSSGSTYFVQLPTISNGKSLVQFNDWNNAAQNWFTGAYAKTADKLTDGETLVAHQMDKTTASMKGLHQGDLVHYKGHISIVYAEMTCTTANNGNTTCTYTDKPVCTTDSKGQTTCTYEIIHAYGGDTYRPS